MRIGTWHEMSIKWSHFFILPILCMTLVACAIPATPTTLTASPRPTLTSSVTLTATPTPLPPTPTFTPTGPTPTLSPTPKTVYLNSFAVDFSVDGRFLAFNSSLDGLALQDHNGQMDAFIYDTARDAIELASVFDQNEQLMTPAPQAISLSADGRYLLFGGIENSLEPSEEHYSYVFLRDRTMAGTQRIDLSALSNMLHASLVASRLSPDGRYLALEASERQTDLYLYELSSNQATLVSAGRDGQEADGSSFYPVFSPDGTFLAFFSTASNLVGGDTRCSDANPACGDVFLYEIETGQLELIPAGLIMRLGYYHSLAISNHAKQVAWTGYGEDGDFPSVVRLFDRLNDKTEVVCAGEPCSGHSPVLSADGRWLAFATMSEVAFQGIFEANQPGGNYSQVYLHDRERDETVLVSTNAVGKQGNGDSGEIHLQGEGWNSDLTISADGEWVAFASQATNLLPAGIEKRSCYDAYLVGAYTCYDLFVYQRQSGTLTWISHPR